MAKKAYVGVSGTPKNIKAIYVGVNGVPKKVVKGYVGVNGAPQVFFEENRGLYVTVTTSIRNYNTSSIDFTNAVLDVGTLSSSRNPMTLGKYIMLGSTASFYDTQSKRVNSTSSATMTVITDTPTKATIVYEGSFQSTKSGTEFYISGTTKDWRVSNISFSGGETYSFAIDIEIEGNT